MEDRLIVTASPQIRDTSTTRGLMGNVVIALLPAVLYLGLHTPEGQIVTPIVLGRRMAISPLVLILGLMTFGWLWGVVGLLLAVPLLACVKLALERLHGMEAWARLME